MLISSDHTVKLAQMSEHKIVTIWSWVPLMASIRDTTHSSISCCSWILGICDANSSSYQVVSDSPALILTLFLILAFLIPSHASGLSECKWPCPKPNIKLTKTYLGPNTILSYVAANRLFPLSQFPCLKWRCWARLCKKEKNTLTMSLDNSGGNQEHFFSP